MLLKCYVNCITDVQMAIKCDVMNVKAYWRGCGGSLKIDLFTQARKFCNEGIKIENMDVDSQRHTHKSSFLEYSNELKKIEKRRKELKEIEKNKYSKNMSMENELIDKILKKRGLTYVKCPHEFPQVADMCVCVCEGKLIFPVVCLYDESMQSDVIQSVHENDGIDTHLKQLFPGDSFPPWDSNRRYTHDKLIIFAEYPEITHTHSDSDDDDTHTHKDVKMIQIPSNFTISKLVKVLRIAPSVVVLHIFPKDCSAIEMFRTHNTCIDVHKL
eukprot:GHVR01086167.1.p1 GENE.GHVR01086167.1~~GHVR01086167.1.p1  ORF type:complete len:271 (+),score=78.67 GHVR01086167.1:252-1064(+)